MSDLETIGRLTRCAASPAVQGGEDVNWKTCRTHGGAKPNVWGCPECLRELREENKHLRETLVEPVAQKAAEIERERTARKTAQESLERYKGECTRLQHEVDRLKGEARLINRREYEAAELRPAL